MNDQVLMMTQQMCQTYAERQGTLTEYEMLLYEQAARTLSLYFVVMEVMYKIHKIQTEQELYKTTQQHQQWLEEKSNDDRRTET